MLGARTLTWTLMRPSTCLGYDRKWGCIDNLIHNLLTKSHGPPGQLRATAVALNPKPYISVYSLFTAVCEVLLRLCFRVSQGLYHTAKVPVQASLRERLRKACRSCLPHGLDGLTHFAECVPQVPSGASDEQAGQLLWQAQLEAPAPKSLCRLRRAGTTTLNPKLLDPKPWHKGLAGP